MNLADARARLRRGFARIWSKIKRRLGIAERGWGSEAQSEGQQYFRTQYERMVDMLPSLPRMATNETNEAFLAFARVVQQLHEMGDDPINAPGVHRVVRSDDRLAAFGAMDRPAGIMGTLTNTGSGGWVAWGVIIALVASGWVAAGVQGALKEGVEAQRDKWKADYTQVARANESLRAANADLSQMVSAADAQTRQTVATIEEERARRVRAEAEARRIRNEMDQARAGGPVDYGFGSVRNDGPGAGAAAPNRRNPARSGGG